MRQRFRIGLEDRLLPVQAYFNALPDDIFLQCLGYLAEGIGYEYNGVGCYPAGEYEGAPETGVLFFIPFEEVTISSAETLQHLRQALDAHVKSNIRDRGAADELYQRIVQKLKG
jgi:hypothetical protein